MAKRNKNGRPRHDGARYASGRLKPKTFAPNPTVVAQRRQMLGVAPGEDADLTKAENPLDLALIRRWMTKERYAAALAYAGLFRGIDIPRVKVGRDPSDLARAEKKDPVGRINWSQWPAAEVTALFDAVMASTPSDASPRDERPMVPDRLRAIWAVVSAEQAREMFSVCVAGNWPQWLISRIGGETIHPGARRRQRLLECGLDEVIKVLKPAKASEQISLHMGPMSVPHAPRAKRVVDRVAYVDQDGTPLFQVERLG